MVAGRDDDSVRIRAEPTRRRDFTIRPDGSGLTTLFEDPGGAFPIDPIWSPDGSQIMFMLDPISDRFTHPNNVLYVMRSDGTDVTKLIDTPTFKSSPEWWLP